GPGGGASPPALRATPAAAALSFPAPAPMDPAAFPLGVRKIVLDPGHGGRDDGAMTEAGLREKDLTLDVARRLRRLLLDQAFEVLMTRDRDEAVSLRQRAQFANAEGADLFVSIHVNSIPARECHADDEEARLLAEPDYREKIARGLFLGIRAYAEAKNRLARQGS